MIKVFVTKQSNFPVKSTEIKKRLSKFFENRGIVSDAEVSVAIVGNAKMLEVSKKFLKDSKIHNVLSFTPSEIKGKFVYPPAEIVHLGEIIVCYPEAIKEAQEQNVLIKDRIYELIEHGALHLLGIHHKE